MPQVSVMDIYTEYVRLRQSGEPMEVAVKGMQRMVDQLDQSQRSQLNLLVRQWEARDSNQHLLEKAPEQPKGKSAAVKPLGALPATDPAPRPAAIRPIRPITPPAPTPTPNSSRPVQPAAPPPSSGFGDSAPDGMIFCPQCGKQNRNTDNYCFSCGHLLELPRASGSTKGLVEAGVDAATRWGTAYFSGQSKLILLIRGSSLPIDVFADREMIIGRASSDSPMRPDIDLAHFDAENLGVSRLHASFRRDESTIQITDLSSRNYTHINGQRLFPREVRVLHDGDEVRLGRLSFRAIFKQNNGR
jgi:hypothetical protein